MIAGKPSAVAAALITAAALYFSLCSSAAYAVDMRQRRQPKDLPPAVRNQLSDMLSEKVEPYLEAEEDKKRKGQPYTDLQPKFEYLPTYGPGGTTVVSAKLGGAEYNPAKPAKSDKGAATGKLKYLVFTYALQNGKWIEYKKPKWESQDLGAAAGKKMTAAADRAEKIKAERAKMKARAEAMQKALNQKTGNP